MTDCTRCHHPDHAGLCGFAITETIRDDVGIFAPPTHVERTLLVGHCRCVDYHHARDIPDVTFLRAVARCQEADPRMPNGWRWALRDDVTRVLGGIPPDANVSSSEVPGVPWKVVLAKFRRVRDRGLVDGCDCGCRGDFELTEAGRELLASVDEVGEK